MVKIGERASVASRDYTSHIKAISREGAERKIRSYADQSAKTENWDLLIAGHVHIKDEYTIPAFGDRPAKHMINLGSWYDTPQALILDNQGQTRWMNVIEV